MFGFFPLRVVFGVVCNLLGVQALPRAEGAGEGRHSSQFEGLALLRVCCMGEDA